MKSSTNRALVAKKQSTSFAQVANNLLNVLQGYSKSIRLLLVMFLTLTVTTNLWGAGTETFEKAANSASYGYVSWTGVNGLQWSASSFRTDQKISGNRGLTSKASTACTITMPLTSVQQSEGMGVFTFKYKYPFSDSGKKNNLSFIINGTTYTGTVSYNSNAQTVNITVNQSNLPATITINIASGGRACFDDFSWTSYVSANPHTVTFHTTATAETPLTEASAGDGVIPPTMEQECSGWTFRGWSESPSNSETSTTELELVTLTNGKYYPTEDVNLYPVYTKTTNTGGTTFDKYTKVDLGGTITSGKYLISTGSYTMAGNGNTGVSFSPGSTEKTTYEYTITIDGDYFTIKGPDGKYVGGKDGTSLAFGTTVANDSYRWKYVNYSGIQNKSYTTRHIKAFGTTDFRHYTTSNGTLTYLYKRTEKSSGSTYYYSYPSCTTEATVTLNPNGGAISEDGWETTDGGDTYTKNVETTSDVTLPTPTKEGYTFGGWYEYSDFTGNAVTAVPEYTEGEKTYYAKWNCTDPTDVTITGEYVHFPGETLTLTVVGSNIAADATYQWYKKNGENYDELTGQTANKLTIAEATANDAGNYKCVVTNGTCSAENDFTVKMYSLRGLIDWFTDCSFTKVNATTATYSMELAANSSYEFKVYDGSAYYGNEGDNPTMTSTNCTNWEMRQNTGNNVTLQTTAAGTYTFTLNYTDASNPTISVTYPAKRIVYLNPEGVWAIDNPKFAVHAWHGSTTEDILMTKIDDCNNRNIYYAEIDATHTHVIFIRGNKDSYNISDPWQNVWNQTGDLTIDNVQYNIGNKWDFSEASWTSFTPNYTVTFDANGHGTDPADQCIAKNGKATTPAAPTATGYTFGGWYKEAGCANAWDFANDVVTEDITLYAKWTINTHTITWMVGSNSVLTEEVASATGVNQTPDNPANGAIGECANAFMGWSETPLGSTEGQSAPADLCTAAQMKAKYTSVTGDKTFYAVFATAKTDEGEDDVTTTFDFTSGYENGTVIGTKTQDDVTITFGKGDNSSNKPTYYNTGNAVRVYAKNTITVACTGLTKITFTFGSDDGSNDITANTGSFSTPTWTGSANSVKFTIGGSSGNRRIQKVAVTYTATALITTYSNYVTNCCNTPAPTNGTFDNVTGSGNAMSLTLNWEGSASRYHITGGNLAAEGIYTSETSYTVNNLTECEEYIFNVTAYPEDGCESAAIQISAQPFSGAKTVTFVYGNEQPNTTFTTDCDNQSTALPNPTRSGYRFLGWFTEESGGTEITENPYTPTADIPLYAQWVQVFTVTYDANNATSGTVPTDANSPYDINKIVTVQGNTGNLQRLGYNFVGWNTAIDASGTQYSAGQTFTITENTTLYAQWIENYCTLTFTIPSGGGQAVSAPEQVLNGYPITFPEVTGISSEYLCEIFIGWTTEEPNGEGLWDGTPTIYDSGTNSEAITANTIFYAVYQRSGGGASGSVQLTNTKIATRGYDADESSITEEDGSVWGIKCYVGNSSGSLFMQLKDGSYYIKTPTVAGNITSLTINYTAVSSDSRTIYFNTEASKDGAVTHQFNAPSVDPSSGNHDYTWDVSAANTKTGYILASSTFKINSIKLDYGPAPIISHSLQCGCAIDEFDLTYDANETNFPNSTTNCEGVTGYKFSEHEDKYTICSSVPTLDGYKFIGWTTNANGSGDLYTSGQEIKCVPSSDITLYAQYERVYTVIFDNQNTINATTQTESGAAVDVPTATEPCGSEWQFVGWSTEEIAPMSLKPTITIEPGTNTYIPEGNVTLYAIYQKTSLSKEFVAGKTGAYKISNGSDKYASSFYNGRLNSADNLAEATTYYITYTASDDGKYTIQQADGLYIAYSGESTSLEKSEEPYYWKITKNGELWQVATIPAGRYLKYSTEFRAYTEAGNIGLIATEGQYYYRTMSCDDNFDITFNNQNGAIIHWQNGYPQAAYQDLEGGTTITTFPMASYEGWTFIGWRAQEYEESTSAPESSSVYGGLDGISGNALTITADVTMYPVFTQFLDNEPFDMVNGGDYYIYYIADGDIDTSVDEYGAAHRIYAGGWQSGGTTDSYGATQSCAIATLFTFTKQSNGKWTIYDHTKGKYLCAGATDNNLALNATTATNGEWTITVHNGNQVNAVSKDGYTLSAYSQDAVSGTFKNYATSNFNNNSEYYHRIYVGSCTERVFTTAPSTEPIITLNGDVKVTSTATQSVKAASVLTVSASNIATSNLSITSDNAAFIVSPTTITVVDKKVGVTPITITYNPTITSDGTETATITVSDGNEASESITVTGRHLPENFVIAAKWGDNWYAMPANMNSQSSTEGWLIEVDDAANPTKALTAPNTTKYGLKSVYTSNSSDDRFENYGERLVFVENVTEATPVANKTLYNGGGSGTSNTNIQVYAQYTNYYNDDAQAPRYEWTPTTTNLQDYTLTSAHQFTKDAGTLENARTVSLDNHGMFGTLLQDKSYNGMVRLLPVDNFYAPAELQVVEWKQNSVSVMYTGAGTKYTTKVGNNAESSVQALSSIDHAVYSLATTDLTAATNQPLVITIKDDAEATIGVIKLTIPAIVVGEKNITELGVTEENVTKATSIVVLSGATLTASTTKYTYDDVVVYPGGKLVIRKSGKLGMYTLTLRLGSSWGAAEYEYKYPQFVLNTTTDGAYSNTSGQINLDYVTTKDQYYTFVAPFEVKTKDIKYPIDIYGTNVTINNKGSFEFEYYDGAARAAGNTGWTTVAEDPETGADLTPGQGYTFLGMPKKVSVNGATSSRQKYGIHRIPMKVSASAAQTHETTNQTVPLAVTLAEKDNDSGWNIVGNPYMSNVAGLTNDDIQVGELVHTNDANGNWTGKWHWDNPTTGQRFLVIPRNDGQSYDAVQASNATLHAFKHFFVQINKVANAMSIPVANRVDRNLAPARYAQAEIEKDIEIAVQMTGDKLNDQMDFLINDIYSTAFEKNADFTKMMNATNFNIYGVHVDNNLSFVALDKAAAMQSVAIGFQVPKAGEYQLSLSDKPYVMADKIEALFVTDHEASPEVTTNLVDEDYTFYVNKAETNNTRFTVSIILKPEKENTPTGVDNIDTKGKQPIKFLYQDKIYILRNGMIYDTTGKQVITINK